MENLEESQRLAAGERKKKSERRQRTNEEAVARPLHNGDEIPPAYVPDLYSIPTSKRLPS